MMKKIEIKKDFSYGRLTIIKEIENSKRRRGLFKCSCGNEIEVQLNHVISGGVKSCGCLRKESTSNNFKTHGLSNTSEFNTWCLMKKRCYDEKDKRYNDWGGRGIKVCDRWLNSFENFIKDMGFKPTKTHSIDRIDNNGNYEPSNCRWATRSEQMKNRRPFERNKKI